jgi:DNA (cytosine-5)-methyltransferase 1
MTHGSLFSGIGGFDLAAEWMGWENIFHCEWNEFGQKVLHHYWPKAISYNDITKTDFTIHRGTIDILTGGFPCQPYSMAGKRKGKEDERHLWPEMLRAIKEIQPRWVVGENVLGLVNWSGGLVFHEVQADLEAAGYEVWPYVLAAASVGSVHRRDRIWFVAYAKNYGCKQPGEGVDKWQEYQLQDRDKIRDISTTNGEKSTTPYPDTTRCKNWNKQHRGQQTQDGEGQRCTCGYCIRIDKSHAPHPNRNGLNGSDCQHEEQPGEGGEYAQRNFEQMGGDVADTISIGGNENERWANRKPNEYDKVSTPGNWQNFPTQSPICTGDDGLSSGLDGITFSKWRNESIKAAGNAIVPQVVLQIFKAIQQYETTPPLENTL